MNSFIMELMRWRDRRSLRRAAVGAAVALALLTAGIWTVIDRRERAHHEA